MNAVEVNAREAAEEAHLLFGAGHFSGACSRAYYAMFNMARALLMSRELEIEEVKTHRSVLRLFSREFVQSGAYPPDAGRAQHRAADARHMADYEGGVSRDDAAEVISSMDAFMLRAEEILAHGR
jgi:uncharacterized protein (UPF0332 family)